MDTLDRIGQNIIYCDIDSEGMEGLDPNFSKLFRLSQLLLQFVLHLHSQATTETALARKQTDNITKVVFHTFSWCFLVARPNYPPSFLAPSPHDSECIGLTQDAESAKAEIVSLQKELQKRKQQLQSYQRMVDTQASAFQVGSSLPNNNNNNNNSSLMLLGELT